MKGHNVLRWPIRSVDEFKAQPGAERHSVARAVGEPARRTGVLRQRQAIRVRHGARQRSRRDSHPRISADHRINGRWSRSKADDAARWVTSRLEFSRQPAWMKQWPFRAHDRDHLRLAGRALEVRTTITNIGAEPMPVAIGFHPYFKLTDSPRDEWTIAVGARTRWLLAANKLPTGETEPIERLFPNPQAARAQGLQPGRCVRRSGARCGGPRHDVGDREVAAARRRRWVPVTVRR